MRDRLIELLQGADKKCADTKQCENCVGYGNGSECVNYLIADYLLANGVIVPDIRGVAIHNHYSYVEVIGNIHDNPELLKGE